VAIQVLVGKWIGLLFLFYLFVLSVKMYRRKITPRSASIFLGIFGLFFLILLFKGLIWEEGVLGTEISQFFASFLGKPGTFILYLIIGLGVFYLFWEEFPHILRLPPLPKSPKLFLKNPLKELKKLLAHPFHSLTHLQREIREKVENWGDVTEKVTEKLRVIAPNLYSDIEVGKGEPVSDSKSQKRKKSKSHSSKGVKRGDRDSSTPPAEGELQIEKGKELGEGVDTLFQLGEKKSFSIGETFYPLKLLSSPRRSNRRGEGELEKKEALLKGVISQLGIPGKLIYRGRGPVVSVFEIEGEKPLPSPLFSRLEKELKEVFWGRGVELFPLSRVRWEIEIPNRRREKVYFRKLLEELEGALPVEGVANLPLPIGVERLGTPLFFRLGELFPLLIGGGSGTGKSLLIHSLLLTLLRHLSATQLKVGIVSSNPNEFYLYNRLPHLIGGVASPAQGRILMEKILETPPTTPIVLVVEEGEEMVEELGSPQLIEEILALPRVYPLFTTGRGGINGVFAPLLSHFPTRIGFKLEEKEAQTLVGTPAPANLLDYGDAVLSRRRGFPLRFHTPYLRRWEVRKVIEYLSQS
jgi:hypothetical protein